MTKRFLASLLSFIWLTLAASLAFGQTPTLVQSVTTSTNPNGIGDSGNTYKITLPNAVGSGNCLILQVSINSTATVSTISDTINGSWSTTAAATVVDGSRLSVFLFPNSASGVDTLTFTLTAADSGVTFRFMEWNNIATTSPANGTATASNISGTSLATGSFTPGANAAGNLILDFCDADGGASHNPTGWTAGTSFTLHDADISWISNQGFPKASQYFFQSTPAAINPAITIAGDALDTFNCVAIALKVASAGTAPGNGIRILKIIHSANSSAPTTPFKMQFPAAGNLRVVDTTTSQGGWDITSVTDSNSNTYTAELGGSAAGPQLFFAQGQSANQNMTMNVNFSGAAPGGGVVLKFYDIINAANSGQPGNVAAANAATGTTVNIPTITPIQANDLLIGALTLGNGPNTSITAPTGVIWDNVPYTGETDGGFFNFGDGWAHFYNTSTASETWTWTTANAGANALVVEFKTAAAGTSCPPPSIALLGVGC